jgi:hypothetical protein
MGGIQGQIAILSALACRTRHRRAASFMPAARVWWGAMSEKAETVRPIIDQVMRPGATSLRPIAAALTVRGIRTARGGMRWHLERIAAILRPTGGVGQLALDGHRLNPESGRRLR